MKTSLFDFHLPEPLIATHPASPRDAARMLIVPPPLGGRLGGGRNRESFPNYVPLPASPLEGEETFCDSFIRELPQFLRPNDVMVFNDTKVIPARLFGKRGEAKVEVLLHRAATQPEVRGQTLDIRKESYLTSDVYRLTSGARWRAFARPAKRLKPGDRIDFADDFSAIVVEKLPSGEVVLQFVGDLYTKLEKYGHMPLPPYIRRADAAPDRAQYQTIYARAEGSVAAPTAGLHFTPELLKAIEAAGVARAHVTLHVGGGTFLPVKTDDTENHVMHSEFAHLTQEAAAAINDAKQKGGRVIAVGTTSLRTLESAADAHGNLKANSFETDIFITPGYRFKITDMLLTNFHLPRSTLFMLVCAFAGLERMHAAYAHAIAENYRFYSYGDACLLFR